MVWDEKKETSSKVVCALWSLLANHIFRWLKSTSWSQIIYIYLRNSQTLVICNDFGNNPLQYSIDRYVYTIGRYIIIIHGLWTRTLTETDKDKQTEKRERDELWHCVITVIKHYTRFECVYMFLLLLCLICKPNHRSCWSNALQFTIMRFWVYLYIHILSSSSTIVFK